MVGLALHLSPEEKVVFKHIGTKIKCCMILASMHAFGFLTSTGVTHIDLMGW